MSSNDVIFSSHILESSPLPTSHSKEEAIFCPSLQLHDCFTEKFDSSLGFNLHFQTKVMLGQVSLGLGLGAMVCKCNFLPRNKTNCSVKLSCRFRDLTAKIIMHIWITRRIISTEYGLDFLDLTENLVLV